MHYFSHKAISTIKTKESSVRLEFLDRVWAIGTSYGVNSPLFRSFNSRMASKTSKKNDGAGLVEGLRHVATSERLRSNHIMTLELMEETTEENATLKSINKKLLAKLNQLNADVDIEAEDEDSNEKEVEEKSTKIMIGRLMKQDKDLAELRKETKLLKGKQLQDEKRIRDLERSNDSNSQLRKELDTFKSAANSTLEDDNNKLILENQMLKSQLIDHIPECSRIITNLKIQLKLLEEDNNQKNDDDIEASEAVATSAATTTTELNEALQKIELLNNEINK